MEAEECDTKLPFFLLLMTCSEFVAFHEHFFSQFRGGCKYERLCYLVSREWEGPCEIALYNSHTTGMCCFLP